MTGHMVQILIADWTIQSKHILLVYPGPNSTKRFRAVKRAAPRMADHHIRAEEIVKIEVQSSYYIDRLSSLFHIKTLRNEQIIPTWHFECNE